METWPKDHSFALYALRVQDVFLLDNYGGSHKITIEQYFNGTMFTNKRLRGHDAISL